MTSGTPVNFVWLYNYEVDGATLTPNLGELCPGQDVVLTCSTTNGDVMMNLQNSLHQTQLTQLEM